MRTKILLFALVVLTISLASADIIVTQQPQEKYNMGDVVGFNVKALDASGIQGFLNIVLICNGQETEVHKEFLSLSPGEEKKVETKIPLTKSFVGKTTGTCSIKSSIGETFVLSEDFEVTDVIVLSLKENAASVKPGKSISFEGSAIKENGQAVKGFIDVVVLSDGNEMAFTETVSNGYFNTNISIPKTMSAEEYTITFSAYEKDLDGEKVNSGYAQSSFVVEQVPTNLEIISEDNIVPGTKTKINVILHDQTGEPISSTTFITIKDSKNKILEQIEIGTGEDFEYEFVYDFPPQEIEITAVSNELRAITSPEITANMVVRTSLINQTLIVKNVGNVPYNNSINVKIGNETIAIPLFLEVNNEEKFELTAPEGEYDVEVLAEGSDKLTQRAFLTGNAIDIKDASEGALRIVRHPIVWLFILVVLGFLAYILFKKGYKKSFFGYIRRRKEIPYVGGLKKEDKSGLVRKSNPAETSLSINGDKQDSSIFLLKIKNLSEVSQSDSAKESLQKIVSFAESQKALTYENGDSLTFILAPTKTKTFRNEATVIEIAKKAKEVLDYNNKMFKQKVNYGISLSHGSLVIKEDHENYKFMAIGPIMNNLKKIASVSDGEILMSDKIKEKLGNAIKYEKKTLSGVDVFELKEIKNNEQHEKFLKSFVRRMEGKK